MKKPIVFAALAIFALYFNTVVFTRINLNGISPDIILASCVSVGVLCGFKTGALFGVAMGFVVDIVFAKYIGLNAMGYMLAGVLGSIFFQKYYADNTIIPAVVSLGASILKEHIMFAAAAFSGGRTSYFASLVKYILPVATLSALITLLIHFLLKPNLQKQLKTEHRSNRARGGRSI